LHLKTKKSRAAELILANKELDYQNQEKQNRATELITANNNCPSKSRKTK
jgi:hypothetical protein